MPRERRTDELLALKEIAETLNTSNDLYHMLRAVLQKLIDVTGLSTGWIFLVEEKAEYQCIADHNLPPALSWGEKRPMCQGNCWCLNRYWEGNLNHAVNIINCKRIEDAIQLKWGDTKGILHHATVPLEAGGEMFGILNVAAPGKHNFTEEELVLLQSVAYQIGMAVKRTKLYLTQRKRAENYARLGEVSHELGPIIDMDLIPFEVVKIIGKVFELPSVGFIVREGTFFSLRSAYVDGEVKKQWKNFTVEDAGLIGQAFNANQPVYHNNKPHLLSQLKLFGFTNCQSAAAIPLRIREDIYGVLLLGSEQKKLFDENDDEVLLALADHISLAFENARLNAQRRELAKNEERNRLARDLHDSVSQTLFSLTLTAHGVETIVSEESLLVRDSLKEIQKLAKDALKEMRSLIWQLRPAGLEDGLVTGLKRYAESQGLLVNEQVEGLCEIPRLIEETLWRIGQEAINNVRKHAEISEMIIKLKLDDGKITMEISDKGCGFVPWHTDNHQSYGLLTMRERTEMLGGLFSLHTARGEGTTIQIIIPLIAKGGKHEN